MPRRELEAFPVSTAFMSLTFMINTNYAIIDDHVVPIVKDHNSVKSLLLNDEGAERYLHTMRGPCPLHLLDHIPRLVTESERLLFE